jgi:DNA repair exonuclease SbcCD ATPase subunit
MAFDKIQSTESELDRTDKLPILVGISIDEDVEDDAVRLEYTATMPGTSIVTSATPADYRSSALDLPSLAESVRSVEERIARQNADYEALNRLYERARDAQLAAGTRADELASELGMAHSTLAVEQHRARELQTALIERNTASEQVRVRAEEALRESERAQSEARTLREALLSRDATIAQVLHSLGERDAQLSTLQREHARVVPDLEARSQSNVLLDRLVKETKAEAAALALDLKASRQSIAELMDRVARAESELKANRRDLADAKAQADAHLEVLRTREWRGGFNQNLFREWDQKIDAAQSGRGALQAECDQLKLTVAAMNAKIAEQSEAVEKLNASKMSEAAAFAKKAQEAQEIERGRGELLVQIGQLNAERKGLESELAARARDVSELRSQVAADAQRAGESVAATEAARAALAARIEKLETEAKIHEEEMTVLMAHLNEARRPMQAVQADFKRLNDELAQKIVILEQLTEENRTLRTNLERTRGHLEERDLLIRRLERSASNNANVLGRLQTSIERLGGGTPPSGPVGLPDYQAELVRIDCEQPITFPLARRTRIGRAPGCELQIDSQSVSRSHAMILKGARELIVEDLNSTNGVMVNGRKVTRQLLKDGDVLTVGEIQFRCVLKSKSAEGSADLAPAAAPTPAIAVTNLSELRPTDGAKGEPPA